MSEAQVVINKSGFFSWQLWRHYCRSSSILLIGLDYNYRDMLNGFAFVEGYVLGALYIYIYIYINNLKKTKKQQQSVTLG